jgi:hypothetical protein
MIEDDFYATIKLKTGEEIFAKIAPNTEDGLTMLLVTNPIMICEIKGRSGVSGYKIEPWLKTSSEDMFIINMEDVLTLSESKNIEMIMMYQTYVRKSNNIRSNKTVVSRKMGYIANVNDAKEILEKLYRNS